MQEMHRIPMSADQALSEEERGPVQFVRDDLDFLPNVVRISWRRSERLGIKSFSVYAHHSQVCGSGRRRENGKP